jgi:hypothetical protein
VLAFPSNRKSTPERPIVAASNGNGVWISEADAAIRRLADWVRPKLGLG